MASGAHSSNVRPAPQALAAAALLAVLAVLALPHVSGARLWPAALLLAALLAGAAGVRACPVQVRMASRLWFMAAAALGYAGWCEWQLAGWQRLRWPLEVVEKRFVEARIVGIPERSGADLRLVAEVRTDPADPWRRVQVRWANAPAAHAGERWRWLLELRAARAWANPGVHDAERDYLRDGIHALGSVRASPRNQRLAPGGGLHRWRERIGAHIRAIVPERDSSALLVALAIGDGQWLGREQWRVFNAAGITHLVAISGLHVTLFCVLMVRCARWLWRRWRWLQQRCACDRWSLVLGWCASACYALLAGWSVPTQRTLLMLAAWHGARLWRRAPAAVPSWSLALLAVLLLDPFAPLAAGFWLSFIAVAVLMLDGAGAAGGLPQRADRRLWQRLRGACGDLVRTQWRVSLALVPCTLAVFGTFAPLAPLVNLAAIPFFSFWLVPLLLIGCLLDGCLHVFGVTPGAWLLRLAAWSVQQGWPLLDAAAEPAWAVLPAQPPPWWQLLAAPAVLLWLLPAPSALRRAAVLLPLPLLALRADALQEGECRVQVLESGRGEAVLVRTATHTLLFDDGESWNSAGRVSAGTVLGVLRGTGRTRLDALILPQLDRDRSAGVAALEASIAVAERRAAGPPPPGYRRCDGTGWNWDGVQFTTVAGGQAGAQGCGLLIAAAGLRVLIGGTLRAAAAQPALAGAEVLIAARHGADGVLWPQSPGHPLQVLVSRDWQVAPPATLRGALAHWRQGGATVHVTALEGALELRLRPGRPPLLRTERTGRLQHPWRWPAADWEL